MVNDSLNPIEVSLNPNRYKSSVLHECIHIIYNSMTDKRIVWLDEGLAMNLSGERNNLKDEESFKNYMTQKISSMNPPSNMNQLSHGEMFVNEEYNGYELSYLAVRYLLETKSKDEIHEMIKNSYKALEIGNEILPCALNYFKIKLEINNQAVSRR